MGVNISPLVEDIKQEKELEQLSSKRVALDGFNTLYQFLASIRQPDGTPLKDFEGNVTSHLSGLFYRNINLISYGISIVYVFDGKPPSFKRHTIEERQRKKKEAEELLRKAKDYEEIESMEVFAKQTLRLTKDMIEDSKKLLEAMGIPYVEAPSEGEAQAAYMASKGIVDASASQDYDSLLFGSPDLIRNLSITGRRKLPRKNEYITVKPEEILLKEVLGGLGISREQLICIGILTGTDFNEGVKGIGPKTALKIVKEYIDIDNILMYVSNKYDHAFEDYIKEVYEFFLHPPTKDVKLEKMELNEDAIIELLVEKHDFSKERVLNGIERIKKAKEKERQRSIREWFS